MTTNLKNLNNKLQGKHSVKKFLKPCQNYKSKLFILYIFIPQPAFWQWRGMITRKVVYAKFNNKAWKKAWLGFSTHNKAPLNFFFGLIFMPQKKKQTHTNDWWWKFIHHLYHFSDIFFCLSNLHLYCFYFL